MLEYDWQRFEAAQKRSTIRAREAHIPAPILGAKRLGEKMSAVKHSLMPKPKPSETFRAGISSPDREWG